MNKQRFHFKVIGQWGNARAGELATPHGTIETPVFMPVGTQGSVKALDSQDLDRLGAQIILGNTYHLYLRPGMRVMQTLGGLHSLMQWPHPILTDSGGYQVSSMGLFKAGRPDRLTTVDEAGVTFKSYLDGSSHRLTPRKVMQIQAAIGSDIMMAFDEATPEAGKLYAREAMERTHRWLDECIKEWQRLESEKTDQSPQALFGIIQGGDYPDLRRISAEWVVSKDLPGVALGGASVGQADDVTEANMAYVRECLPKDKPVYFMGVGISPQAAVSAIKAGADMFDCVAPTRLARCGLLYTGKLENGSFQSEDSKGRINIGNSQYALDHAVIEPRCDCDTCSMGYSRAYLHHLFKCRELAYYRLASIHNLRMMIKTVDEMRLTINKLGVVS